MRRLRAILTGLGELLAALAGLAFLLAAASTTL